MKTWTKSEMKQYLETAGPVVLHRALLAIQAMQTDQEQQAERTIVHNKVGFSAFHAEPAALYLKLYPGKAWRATGCGWGPKMLEKVRKLVLRYVGQLTDIANAKAEAAERSVA